MTNYFEDEKPTPWTLADVYNDLGARGDISKTLDVTPYRVVKWLERGDKINCPKPVRRISHIDIYSMQEWKDWYARWIAKHKPKTKWTDDAKSHGSGKPFFTYFND